MNGCVRSGRSQLMEQGMRAGAQPQALRGNGWSLTMVCGRRNDPGSKRVASRKWKAEGSPGGSSQPLWACPPLRGASPVHERNPGTTPLPSLASQSTHATIKPPRHTPPRPSSVCPRRARTVCTQGPVSAPCLPPLISGTPNTSSDQDLE